MNRIVTPTEAKEWDRYCIETLHVPSERLMLRAAEGLEAAVIRRNPENWPITCFCGSGNNGGDGYAAAWLLARRGLQVRIVELGKPERMTDDAGTFRQRAISVGVKMVDQWRPRKREILIDAIFGVGLDRPITGRIRTCIERINESRLPVISADVPSGLDAMLGQPLGIAVQATETVTMQFLKCGLLTDQGRLYSGTVTVCPLHTESAVLSANTMFLQTEEEVQALLPPRPLNSHKGKNGHALLCVGSKTYLGAALLSAKAALRAGCGILSVAIPTPVRSAFRAVPEAITIPIGANGWTAKGMEIASAALEGKTAVGIGCGIGDAEIAPLLEAALRTGKPLVIDADGLNCLSRHRELFSLLHSNVVLTPHPGEMAKLKGCTVDEIVRDPFSATSGFPCTILLKGATMLVTDGNRTAFCIGGNTGLAKGGSGDVLTGMITALLGQGLCAFDAARAGAFLLGASAVKAYELLGTRMLVASDLMDVL